MFLMLLASFLNWFRFGFHLFVMHKGILVNIIIIYKKLFNFNITFNGFFHDISSIIKLSSLAWKNKNYIIIIALPMRQLTTIQIKHCKNEIKVNKFFKHNHIF